jgi:hypothetical protein
MGQPERVGLILGRVMAEIERSRRYNRKGTQLELPFDEEEKNNGSFRALRRADNNDAEGVRSNQ